MHLSYILSYISLTSVEYNLQSIFQCHMFVSRVHQTFTLTGDLPSTSPAWFLIVLNPQLISSGILTMKWWLMTLPGINFPVKQRIRFPLQNVKFLLLKFSTYCTKFYGKSCNSNHSEDWISGSTQSNIKKDFQFQRWDLCCYWKWPRNSESSCNSQCAAIGWRKLYLQTFHLQNSLSSALCSWW